MGPAQRAALELIADTLAPGTGGLPSASELGVPGAFVDLLESHLPEIDRRRVALLLRAWDRLAPLARGAGRRRFSELTAEERAGVMVALCDSRVTQLRTVFQLLRKSLLGLCYMTPSGDGANPAWAELGYPGPPDRPSVPPSRPLTTCVVDGDAVLSCDVCIIGSGAGGGTAAGVLAQAGHDVVVLEAGGYYDGNFTGAELEGYSRLYLNGGAAATADQGIGLLAGATVGGGTTVNFATSFKTPPDVREEWAGSGVPAFAGAEYTESLDAVWQRLRVNTDHSRPSVREQVMKRGLDALGWHAGTVARNVDGCDQGEACGFAGFGCLLACKQSTTETWLADACRAGARLLVQTRAERVIVEQGRARGVVATTATGQSLTVRARAVVVAAGAIHTPAILRRSGLGNPNIGRHLRLHPVTGVAGTFAEDIRPWEGTMQAVYSEQHRDLGGGYGVTYESAPFHPGTLATFAPWRNAADHADLMRTLRHTVPVGVLLRDHGGGEVKVRRDGQPVVHYRLSQIDVEHVRVGVEAAARILEAAGAQRVFSAHSRWTCYEPGKGHLSRFLAAMDSCGWGPGRCVFISFHIMGSARMGGSPARSACNPSGETWDVKDLYVGDGSTFPTASGVNPMISIEATAHLIARQLVERLGRAG